MTRVDAPVTEEGKNILIVDDEELTREALKCLLSLQSDVDTVGVAATPEEAARALERGAWNVVLVDGDLPCGISSLAKGRRVHVVVMLSGIAGERVEEALAAGAGALVTRSVPVSDLLAAIRHDADGSPYIAPSILGELLRERRQAAWPSHCALTEREKQVLELMCSGCSNREIGQTLFLTENTVKSHLRTLFRKLKVNRRAHAALWAVSAGFVSASEGSRRPHPQVGARWTRQNETSGLKR